MIFNQAIQQIKKNYTDFLNKISLNELIDILRKISFLYYNNQNGSPISDEIYDKLYEYVEKKDPTNPFLKETGAEIVNTNEKVKLPHNMSSLDKIKQNQKVIDDYTKKYSGPYMISAKLDGTSLQFYKNKNGEIKLYTRGTGVYGRDVTYLLPFIVKDIKIEKIPNNTSVRGELIITKKSFKEIIEKYGKIYSNARSVPNSMSIVKPEEIEIDKFEYLEFVTYSMLFPRLKISEQFEKLEEYGFKTVDHKLLGKINSSVLSEYMMDLRKNYKYNIDGAVVVDNSAVYDISEDKPKFAFAFKMVLDDQKAEVVVEKVIWQKSMWGYLKPKIKFDPVEIGGVEIKYATAHNAKYVVDNKLGPGSIVIITRSGDVIPFIYKVEKPAENDKPQLPNIKYEWTDKNVDIHVSDEYMKKDPDIRIKQITYFFRTLKIKSLCEQTIKKLFENGYTNEFQILSADREKLKNIKGLGEKLIDKIFDDIDDKMKKIDLVTLMKASRTFGRLLGSKKLKLVIDIYPDMESLLKIKDKLREKLLDIDGFGEKMTNNFIDGIDDFISYFNMMRKKYNLEHLVKKPKKNIKTGLANKWMEELTDKIIVFTGFRDNVLAEKLEASGAKVTTSVSGKTYIVVTKDGMDKTTSKLTKASEKGIIIMDKTDFLKKYHIE